MSQVEASQQEDDGPIYCAEQIRIPPELPDLLKSFTKHIIRTQPGNLLAASAEYFQRLSKVKTDDASGNGAQAANPAPSATLSKIHLEAFYQKFANGNVEVVSKREIENAARGANIAADAVRDVMLLGEWTERVPWLKFWALLAASTTNTLDAAVFVAAEVLADQGRVPTAIIVEVLSFLGQRDPDVGIGQADIAAENILAVGTEIQLDELRQILERDAVPAPFDAGEDEQQEQEEDPEAEQEQEQEQEPEEEAEPTDEA
ncbi:hypothetical protein SmJEL517_g02180 [Synchytrium microbalum]|uniref:RIIa domain-containing protein n=1 Tax=Synchytrium microbalum TaxID=1806994 RepID=A0A507CD27_9FUNG|nr:uncharacterized protein SmJEL517_g02180 [Synchytrium microbalum]TPX35443.1 hypothetical protein SmJEL517_g02180 [Synchytrium microbalum]